MTRNKSRGEYFWCVLTFRIKYLKLDDKCQWRVSSCLNPNTISPKLDRTRKRFKFKFEFAKFQKQFVSLNTWVIAKLELWFFYLPFLPPHPHKKLPVTIYFTFCTNWFVGACKRHFDGGNRSIPSSPVLFLLQILASLSLTKLGFNR